MRKHERIDFHTPETNEPGVHRLGAEQLAAEIDQHVKAVLALCREIYAREGALPDEQRLRILSALLEDDRIDKILPQRSARYKRAISSHIACIQMDSIRVKSENGARLSRNDVDIAVYSAMKTANFFAHGGEDMVTLLEQSFELQELLKTRSSGGRKGTGTRTKWHASARLTFDDYRRRNPHITIATEILTGMDQEGRVPRTSDKRLLELIRSWMKEPQ